LERLELIAGKLALSVLRGGVTVTLLPYPTTFEIFGAALEAQEQSYSPPHIYKTPIS
jgi:hypothetical protein